MSRKNEIKSELLKIAGENGGVITAQMVVDHARNVASPLHDCFEWDNAEAAEQYRLWQARELLRVQVTVIHRNVPETRCFVSLSTDRKTDGGGYRLASVVMADSELRKQMMLDAANELETFTQKYARIKELETVFVASKAYIKKVKRRK